MPQRSKYIILKPYTVNITFMNIKLKILLPLALLATVAAACSDTAAEETTEETETTEAVEVTAEEEPVDQSEETTAEETSEETEQEETSEETLGSAEFSIEDTLVNFSVDSCTNPSETTISFAGESVEGTIIDISAEDQIGGITIDGPEGSWEGSIDAVEVGDSGLFTISGQASIADDSETDGPSNFTLTGQCPLS